MKLTLKICMGLAAAASVILGVLQFAGAADASPAGQTSGVLLSAPTVTNGNLLLVQIDTRKLGAPIPAAELIFQDRTFAVYPHPLSPVHHRFGLIGIPYRQEPGPARLVLKWTNAAGEHAQTIPFEIIAGK